MILIAEVAAHMRSTGETYNEQGQRLLAEGQRLTNAVNGFAQRISQMRIAPAPVITKMHQQAAPPAKRQSPITIEIDVKMPKAERSILTVLAQYPDGRTLNQVALLAGYAIGTGGFNNAISALRTKGYLHGGKERLIITERGYEALGPVDPLPTGQALIDYWMRKLGKAERAAFEVLVRIYPEEMDREALAAEAGYMPGTGGINNAISRLRTLELAVGRARLRANETLFE